MPCQRAAVKPERGWEPSLLKRRLNRKLTSEPNKTGIMRMIRTVLVLGLGWVM